MAMRSWPPSRRRSSRTALQAALRDEDIQFWHTQVYDPAGGFLSSRPYYLEAVPGFEIRVHVSDLRRANEALEWVESKETVSGVRGGFSADDHDPIDLKHDSSRAESEAADAVRALKAQIAIDCAREQGLNLPMIERP